ncbi:MAG TPA: homoserine dehydrogenase [Thermoanaerobaculia bacterium]|nr:homoserine dehydrogenase [Thermoanaerobaculia bacterium]
MRALFLGFGHVGRRLAEILADRSAWPGLAGLEVSVVGIVTGSKGALLDPEGLDLAEALTRFRAHGRFPAGLPAHSAIHGLEAARSLDYDVLVEMTPLDLQGQGRESIHHVRTALARGRHAVSANKGPLAWGYAELHALAQAQGVSFLHEAAVMDGAPVFNLARCGLRGVVIHRLEGLLNSTTNFVLDAMEEGSSLQAAVEEAQRIGVAEADPALDLDGWDAAVKISALANVLLGANLPPEAVERQSLSDLRPGILGSARERGCRTKMVCEVGWEEDRIVGRVRAREVPLDDPFALVTGTGSILRITTDLAGTIVLTEESPNLTTTAYGILSDLLSL